MFERQQSYSSGRVISTTTPVVKWLLILNIGIFILDLFLEGNSGTKPLRSFGIFSINSAILGGAIWEFITFQFLHFGIAHLLMNMVGIFFFGPIVERHFGSRLFIAYYLLCGVGGAALYTLLTFSGLLPHGLSAGLLGASAGIFGILIGVAVIAPGLRVSLLFPPITLTMRQLATLALGFSVFSILLKFGGNEGGEAGHLGGAIVGFLLMKFPFWEKIFGGSPSGPKRGPRTDIGAKIRPRTKIDLKSQDQIDRILEKISEHGFQSLTDEERDLLHRASEQSNRS